MKVQPGMEIKQLVGINYKQPVETDRRASKVEGGDKVDFSADLQQVNKMESRFVPDSARQERLREVKAQIENGSYAPDPLKVAESLLKYVVEGGGRDG